MCTSGVRACAGTLLRYHTIWSRDGCINPTGAGNGRYTDGKPYVRVRFVTLCVCVPNVFFFFFRCARASMRRRQFCVLATEVKNAHTAVIRRRNNTHTHTHNAVAPHDNDKYTCGIPYACVDNISKVITRILTRHHHLTAYRFSPPPPDYRVVSSCTTLSGTCVCFSAAARRLFVMFV